MSFACANNLCFAALMLVLCLVQAYKASLSSGVDSSVVCIVACQWSIELGSHASLAWKPATTISAWLSRPTTSAEVCTHSRMHQILLRLLLFAFVKNVVELNLFHVSSTSPVQFAMTMCIATASNLFHVSSTSPVWVAVSQHWISFMCLVRVQHESKCRIWLLGCMSRCMLLLCCHINASLKR